MSRRAKIAAVAAAGVAAVSIPLGISQIDRTPTHPMALPNGKTVAIPMKDGKATKDVRQPGLYVPKGFPVDALPTKASAYPQKGRDPEKGPGPDVFMSEATYDTGNYDPAHWSNWRWGGFVQNPNIRALIVIDRTGFGERPMVNDFVYAWQNFVRGRLQQRIVDARIPHISYVQDSGAEGQCPARGMWNLLSYSFTTVCTSWDMAANCNPANLGCAWTHGAGGAHHGPSYQPSIWIKAGLPLYSERRNVVHHELFHVMGMPHSLSDECSIMFGRIAACDGAFFDKNLSYDDDGHLAADYNHNPD